MKFWKVLKNCHSSLIVVHDRIEFVLFLVLQIVILQIKAMELKTRVSGKFKTQAQMDGECSLLMFTKSLSGQEVMKLQLWDGLGKFIFMIVSSLFECLIVIISKLEYKNGLLSDLKEEREVRRENREKIGMVCFPVVFFIIPSVIHVMWQIKSSW